MAKIIAPLLPSTSESLARFGDRLRLARLRRRLTAKQVSERAGMSPMTLRSLERGGVGVTMGAYLAVMQVLGIERDLELLAHSDTVGRDLQDARLPSIVRTTSSESRSRGASIDDARRATGSRAAAKNRTRADGDKPGPPASAKEGAWMEDSNFVSSRSLAGLIGVRRSSSKR